MPDITMCSTKTCKSKDTCHRYKVKPDEIWQSYCDFSHGDSIEKCGNYSKYINRELWKNERFRKEIHTKRS